MDLGGAYLYVSELVHRFGMIFKLLVATMKALLFKLFRGLFDEGDSVY